MLVCISEDPRSARASCATAKRLADRLRAPFTALTIESRRSASLSEAERDRIADTLRLAERLGAETATLPSQGRIADDVVAFAREHNDTHVVIGKSTRSRWFELLNGSVVHDHLRRSGPISVHVVAGEEIAGAPAPHQGRAHRRPRRRRAPCPTPPRSPRSRARWASGSCCNPSLGHESTDLVFLTAVVAVAVRFGLNPSLAAVLASSLAYNFFFLPPLYTFTIADPTNVVALFFFTLVAVVVSNLAGRVRAEATISRARSRATEALYASRASSRAAAPSTTCCGPPPTRSP